MNINKWPVIIFASPRTGSNALLHHITNLNTDIKYYIEPAPDFCLEEFIQQSNNRHAIKIIVSHISNYPETLKKYIFSNDNFKIKLNRKNVVEQIASFYLARNRKIWTYYTATTTLKNRTLGGVINDFSSEEIININLEEIKYCIIHMLECNKLCSEIDVNLELYYEDFVNFITPTKKTPKPKNYNELVSIIQDLYSSGIYQS